MLPEESHQVEDAVHAEQVHQQDRPKTEEGGYPFGPSLLALSGSTIPSTYEKSLCSKKSFEENDSSLTGLVFLSFLSLALWPQTRIGPEMALPSFGRSVHHRLCRGVGFRYPPNLNRID
jgi:hypothetical protein